MGKLQLEDGREVAFGNSHIVAAIDGPESAHSGFDYVGPRCVIVTTAGTFVVRATIEEVLSRVATSGAIVE